MPRPAPRSPRRQSPVVGAGGWWQRRFLGGGSQAAVAAWDPKTHPKAARAPVGSDRKEPAASPPAPQARHLMRKGWSSRTSAGVWRWRRESVPHPGARLSSSPTSGPLHRSVCRARPGAPRAMPCPAKVKQRVAGGGRGWRLCPVPSTGGCDPRSPRTHRRSWFRGTGRRQTKRRAWWSRPFGRRRGRRGRPRRGRARAAPSVRPLRAPYGSPSSRTEEAGRFSGGGPRRCAASGTGVPGWLACLTRDRRVRELVPGYGRSPTARARRFCRHTPPRSGPSDAQPWRGWRGWGCWLRSPH